MNTQRQHQAPDTLTSAIALGKAGYNVFPLIENGKIPAVGAWQQRATSDEAEIRKLWTETDPVLGVTRVKPYNIGIHTKDMLVLDVDVREGKRGMETLAELDVMEGVPATFTVRTASGGLHMYFRPKAPVRNSASTRFGPGVDSRGDGGYVVGPGSTIDGVPYTVHKAVVVAEAPEWMERRAGQPMAENERGKQVVEILDTQPAMQRAVEYLKSISPAARPGTFIAACRCKDYGLSELTVLDIMAEHWNGPVHPGMDFEVLAIKVANAFRYGKKPIGEASAQADFEKAEADPFEPKREPPKTRGELLWWDDDDNAPEPDPLIEGILDKGSCTMIYGKPNVGKTFVAYSIARHIAAGVPFAGREVEQGPVLYIQCEGHSGVSRRRKALRMYFKDKNIPFVVVKASVNLVKSAEDREWLGAKVREVTERYGMAPAAVVIDTWSAAAPGMDENAAGDVSAALSAMKRYTCDQGIALIIVHHEGKNAGGGPRGSSAFVGNVDTVIHVRDGMIVSDKAREAAKIEPVPFALEVLTVGRTVKGRPVTSCVARVYTPAEADFGPQVPMTDFEKTAFDRLMELEANREEYAGVSYSEWEDAVVFFVRGDVRADTAKRNLRRSRTNLADKGYVRNDNKNQWFTIPRTNADKVPGHE
jgi:KaiC/GvpD/RAD55 family RecA-like ATPase